MPGSRLALAAALVSALALGQGGKLRPDSTPAEDPQLRARAVALLEKANALSSPVWPMNEEIFHFKVSTPEPGEATEGTLLVGVAAPWKKRWHFVYGTYELDQVQIENEFATYRTGPEPAAVTLIRKLVPVSLIRFDHEDVIRKIEEETVEGNAAQCIYFDTIYADRQIAGKICVDAAKGFVICTETGETIVRQSKYFAFNDGYLPGHLERWTGNKKLAEIDSSVVVKESFPDNYFDLPANAVISHMCRGFQPAVAVNTPQPPTKSDSDSVVDITVHGRIDTDGRPKELKALDTTHSELAAEAVHIVATWTYKAAQCDYRPSTQLADFMVHFKGWQ